MGDTITQLTLFSNLFDALKMKLREKKALICGRIFYISAFISATSPAQNLAGGHKVIGTFHALFAVAIAADPEKQKIR